MTQVNASGTSGAQENPSWFIYVGDHHEGPFSEETLAGWFESGRIHDQTYVWREGLTDWQQIKRTQAFAAWFELPSEPGEINKPPSRWKQYVRSIAKVSGVMSAVGLFIFFAPLGEMRWHAASVLGEWVENGELWLAPAPPLAVSEEALSALLKAALARTPGKVHAVLQDQDPLHPVLLISGNVPEKTRFHVEVTSHQILSDQKVTENYLSGPLENRFAVSPALRGPDKGPLPKGEYLVSIRSQPAGFVLFSEKMFLGGQRDALFLEKIQAMKRKYRTERQAEKLEIQEFYSTLKSQLEATEEQFVVSSKGRDRASWLAFAESWQGLQHELNRMSTEKASAAVHFKKAFEHLSQALQSLHYLHSAQQDLLKSETGTTSSTSLEDSRVALQKALNAVQDELEGDTPEAEEKLFDEA